MNKKEEDFKRWTEIFCIVVNRVLDDAYKEKTTWEESVAIIKSFANNGVFHEEDEK